MVQRTIDITLAALASAAAFLLSWPYWRDFEYWPESRTMWSIYFVAGFILSVYVFSVFLGSLRTLFEHDALERSAALAPKADANDNGEEGRP